MTLGLCNITENLLGEDLCSWTPEKRFVGLKGGEGPV